TEAVETALKLAMHVTGREKFIAFFNSFHGRTLGSLSLTSSKAAQRLGFKRQALDVVHVPYPNEYRNPFNAEDCEGEGAGRGALNWIEKRLFKTTTPPEEVAGIVVEVVQGEGGYVPAPKIFLDGLRSEEHTSELQSRRDLVCRLLLEKKKKKKKKNKTHQKKRVQKNKREYNE